MLSGWAAPAALVEFDEARRKLKNGMVLTLIFIKLVGWLAGRLGVVERR
jgi:hypothetical protein